MEGRFKEVDGVTQDGDVHSIRRQELGYFSVVEAHVVANYVETVSGRVALHLGAQERRRVEEVVAAIGEGELKLVLFPKPEEDVEDGAAGGFMGLHEHDVQRGGALLRLGFGAGHILLRRSCNAERTCVVLGAPCE